MEYRRLWTRITELAEAADQYRKGGSDELAFLSDFESLTLWNRCFARTRDKQTPWNLIKPFPEKAYLRELDRMWLKEPRILIPKCRRMIATWRFISNNTWLFLTHRGAYILLQSREMGDAGLDMEEALLWRVVKMLEDMPACSPLKAKKIKIRKRNQALEYPEMQSAIRGVSADFDAFRTYGPTSVFADELAFQEQPERGMTAAMPALEGSGRYTGVSSVNGENYFWLMCDDKGGEGSTDLSAEYPTLSKFAPARRNKNGFAVAFLHDMCDPEKDVASDAGQKWYARVRPGIPDNQWRQEHEIDPFAIVGTPIFPNFSEPTHCQLGLDPIKDEPIYRGWDPGWGYSVCVLMQIIDDKKVPQVRVLREVHSTNIDVGACRDLALDLTDREYPDWKGRVYDDIDIAALHHSQTSKKTAIDILGEKGINARYQKSGPEDRILLLGHLLASRTSDGRPAFLIDPQGCPNTLRALRGLYRRKKDSDQIEKNEARHFIDALGYPIYNNLWLRFQPAAKKDKPKRMSVSWFSLMNKAGKRSKARYMSA